VRVYSHWVYTAKCIVDVYCDWVYNASSGCTCIVGIYSDWVYNAKCIVGTTHMLKTKPVVLWVHNASYIVVFPETTTTATLVLVCETLQPRFCTVDSLLAVFSLFSTVKLPTKIFNSSCTLIDNIYFNI